MSKDAAAAPSVETLVRAGRVEAILGRAETAGGIAERRFLLDALARALLLADPGTVPDDVAGRADALGADERAVLAARQSARPHAVSVPFVLDGGGLVRQVLVAYDPLGLGTGPLFGPAARQTVDEALARAAEVSPPTSPVSAHRLIAAQPTALEGGRVDGASLGAAAFVSAVSLWSRRAVRPNVVVTGGLAGDRVASVGALAAKLEAVAARPTPSVLIGPGADLAGLTAPAHVTLHGVETLPELLEATLAGPARGAHPEALMAEARRRFATGWQGYRWPEVRAHLEEVAGALPVGRYDLRVESLSRLAATHRHLGDPETALRLLERARTLTDDPEGRLSVPDAPLSYLLQQIAMTCRQLHRFTDAAKAARQAARVAARGRLRGPEIRALGCVGLVAMSRRRVPEAVAAFQRALALQAAHDPERTPRSAGYLIEALGHAGDDAGVRAHFADAMDTVRRVGDREERRGLEAWARTHLADALLQLGNAREAAEALSVPAVERSLAEDPLPGLRARRLLGVAWARSSRPEQAFDLLAAAPVAHGLALLPHLRFLAHLNVLTEARLRMGADALTADAAGRALVALGHLPRYGDAPRRLDRAIAGARRALEGARSGRRATSGGQRALDTLLARCLRLQ